MRHTDYLIDNLNRKGFVSKYFENIEDLRSELLKIIPKSSTIGTGGSMTIKELALPQYLKENGYTIYNKLSCDLDVSEIREKSALSDFFLTSTNAITTDGILVNIDGRGNRISAMANSSSVIHIIGVNKITTNLSDALIRIKNVACPLNTIRLSKNTPCRTSGKCEECESPDRICRATLIQTHPMSAQKAYVFIINKKLGY